jgi:hypothetical protein
MVGLFNLKETETLSGENKDRRKRPREVCSFKTFKSTSII